MLHFTYTNLRISIKGQHMKALGYLLVLLNPFQHLLYFITN